MLGGGGIAEHEASLVTGGGGIFEHEGSAVFGGGGIFDAERGRPSAPARVHRPAGPAAALTPDSIQP